MSGERIVFTVGHSTHTIERFAGLLHQYGVTAVADVRSSPYSRFNPQFNRDALERLGMPVRHILADGKLESHAEAMQRLLSVVGLPESDLFRSQEELIAAACALQEERIAYTDEGMRRPVLSR